MKKTNKTMILVIILIIINIVLATSLIISLNKEEKTIDKEEQQEGNVIDSIKFKKEYEVLNDEKVNENGEQRYSTISIPENNPMEYVTLEELVNIANTQDAYIYVSSATCPFCRATIETLLEVAKECNVEKIYYYDTSKQIIEDEEKYNQLMEQLVEKEIVKKNNDGKTVFGIPIVLKVSDGIVESITRGVAYKREDNQSVHDKITEEQKKQVHDRYYEVLM